MEYKVFYAEKIHETVKGILLKGAFDGKYQEKWFPKAAVKPYGRKGYLAKADLLEKMGIEAAEERFTPEPRGGLGLTTRHNQPRKYKGEWNVYAGQNGLPQQPGTDLKHQSEIRRAVRERYRSAIFGETGTGKTRIALKVAQDLFIQGHIDRLLYICPCNVKHHIEGQLIVHDVLDVPTLIIGIESLSNGLKAYNEALAFGLFRTFVVLDEAHFCKNAEAVRSKRIAELCRNVTFALAMTGTPITQSVADLYGIFHAISPNNPLLGYSSYRRFEKAHLVLGGYNRRQVVGYHNIEPLIKYIKPYTFQVTKKDCLDLPEKTYQTRTVEMGQAAQLEYSQIKAKGLADYADTKSENVILKMFTELQKVISYDNEAKLEAVREIYSERNARLIVWCKFTKEVKELMAAFKEHAYAFYGELSDRDRTASLNAWRNDSQGILIANMAVGGVGIDLVECDRVIYYSNSFKYADRVQSEDRCHRIGQVHSVTYIDLFVECGIDRIIQKSIERKANLADLVRELIAEDKLEL